MGRQGSYQGSQFEAHAEIWDKGQIDSMIHVVMQLCGCDKSQACIAHGLHTTLPGSEAP